MKNFVLIGASGYIAPRHMKAIKQTGNNLLAALDPNDSVGIIDSYFPNASFFTEPELFDRHIEKLKHENNIHIDYFTICSPNYLHDSHIRMGLRNNSHVICEKPLVLNPWNVTRLQKIQNQTQSKVFNILQLREHKSIIDLKSTVDRNPNQLYKIKLTYITSRGNWYYTSWKGMESKSGGVATNIGVHFFDMLTWIFGEVIENKVYINSFDRSSGFLRFKNAEVKWFLSINSDLLPEEQKKLNQKTFRNIEINGSSFEFSDGFTDLHTRVYEKILDGKGYSIEDATSSIEIVHSIRNSKLSPFDENTHSLASINQSKHPFI